MLRLKTTGSISRTKAAIRNTTITTKIIISVIGDHEFNYLLMQSYLSSTVNDHAYSKKTRVSSKRCCGNTPSSALDTKLMILQTPHFICHLVEETNDLSGNVLASGEERVS
jgi:hypothetical protein